MPSPLAGYIHFLFRGTLNLAGRLQEWVHLSCPKVEAFPAQSDGLLVAASLGGHHTRRVNNSMLSIIAGLIAGLIHIFSGPDHLAAVAPLALKQQRGAWRTGLRWGTGHAAGVAFVGILSILLRGLLPVDFISRGSDRLVGGLLIGIGLWALRKAWKIHAHEHQHAGETHVHLHTHSSGKPHPQPHEHRHGHAAFGIGTLHGLSGSAHFLAIIPSLALPLGLAVAYLAAFGIGTVLAMMVFAGVIGSFAVRYAGVTRVYRGLMAGCAIAAIAVGCFWLAGYSW